MDPPTALEYYYFVGLGARRTLYRLTTEDTEYTEGEHRFSWGLFPCVLSVPWFYGLPMRLLALLVVWKSLEEFETQRHRGHGEKKDRGGGERNRIGEEEREEGERGEGRRRRRGEGRIWRLGFGGVF